jgi:hypothetical protein
LFACKFGARFIFSPLIFQSPFRLDFLIKLIARLLNLFYFRTSCYLDFASGTSFKFANLSSKFTRKFWAIALKFGAIKIYLIGRQILK